MKLRKVISGGQTGADRTGLECAKALGLETGGTAPDSWRTDEGHDPTLADFGLKQSSSYSYVPRTRNNAKNSDATVWFGKKSPGYYCTKKACEDYNKPFIENPNEATMREICDTYEVINVAGNRKRTNPTVVSLVQEAFSKITP